MQMFGSRHAQHVSLWFGLACFGCSSSDAKAAPSTAQVAASVKAPAAKSSVDVSAALPPPSAAKPEPEPTPPPQPRGPSVAEVLALQGSHSSSQGAPAAGHVVGAVAIPDSGPGFYHNPIRPDEARFGTVELVQTIVRAAALTDQALPGSVLVVNDLGLPEGGPIAQHGSHQAGRDADILFYSLDAKGVPLPSVGVPIDPKGKGIDFKDLRDPKDDQPVQLDVARTWHFVASLIQVAADNLQRIFIVEHVRTMLLAEAARVHAPKDVVARFADITCQPEAPHDDHMHIRLFCTPEDMAEGCLDGTPTYPFRAAELAKLGLTPHLGSAALTAKARADRRARTTTPSEARKRAGPMHALVTKFLSERNAWIKKPSPGRPYCK
jgi:penicillin-insensitive murein endopeptidase